MYSTLAPKADDDLDAHHSVGVSKSDPGKLSLSDPQKWLLSLRQQGHEAIPILFQQQLSSR